MTRVRCRLSGAYPNSPADEMALPSRRVSYYGISAFLSFPTITLTWMAQQAKRCRKKNRSLKHIPGVGAPCCAFCGLLEDDPRDGKARECDYRGLVQPGETSFPELCEPSRLASLCLEIQETVTQSRQHDPKWQGCKARTGRGNKFPRTVRAGTMHVSHRQRSARRPPRVYRARMKLSFRWESGTGTTMEDQG